MKALHLAALVACLATMAFSRPQRMVKEDGPPPKDQMANMNGLYKISNPNAQGGVVWDSDYSKRPNVSYFDVYTHPIRTRYGEVFWTMMDPVALPDYIIERYKGKAMAIVGYEADQVRKDANGDDESMPIFWQYNHHYCAWMTGDKSTVKEVDEATFRQTMTYGAYDNERFYVPVEVDGDDDVAAAPAGIPTSQFISEGNGGEYRKSFHGYPPKYAQLIYSPNEFRIIPMQIDTHNRDHNKSKFIPGPLPKASGAPPNASYSGLLECPCTDRIKKVIQVTYTAQEKGACGTPVMNATECFAAAATLKVPSDAAHVTVNEPTLPSGCSIVKSQADNSTKVVFNTATKGTAACGGGNLFSGEGSAISNVSLSLTLDASSTDLATITMTGPDGVWYGVGLNAELMENLPYAIIVDGTGAVTERKLGNHDPGKQLATSVKVVSNKVVDGVRTVVMTRPLKGATADHYTFDPLHQATLPFISAVGNTSAFTIHRFKGSATMSVTAMNGATCVCNGGIKGTINGLGFGKDCLDEPYGDLVQQKNPTCWIQTYQGGLRCCHHQWILLDQDQNPWENTIDEYYLKFRFWYEDYDASVPTHTNLERVYWQTEAHAGEYDITKAPEGTPSSQAIQVITAHWQVSQMVQVDKNAKGIELIYAGGHCHAPSCISMELYNADTGKLLCRHLPIYGKGNTDDDKFDELNYLALPPCLWGTEEEGLEKPIFLPYNGNMTSVKRNNNTYTHYGEMASWQMRGAYVY